MNKDFYFQTYSEWREALTRRCGIALTTSYAEERLAALQNTNDPTTAEFVRCYGDAYRKQVMAWFQRAAQEGN